MSLRLREIPLKLGESEDLLPEKITALLNIALTDILCWKIIRKGIDARRKPDVLRVYTIEFSYVDETALLLAQQGNGCLVAVELQSPPEPIVLSRSPQVLVVGMGPAGLFAALQLAQAGAKVTLLERGKPVAQRVADVDKFWSGGELDPESNIQFGEGGAGTFSDGKLTSRLNHPLMRQVLETLVRFGAPEDILLQAKPHVGSDRLRKVLVNFRQHLLQLGVAIRFSTCLTGLEVVDGQIHAGIIDHTERVECDQLVLALGHSARDTYQMLADSEVEMEAKPFAIGLRVEHPLELINQIQYARKSHPQLPAAEYNLAWNDPQTGRGIYSFCMCPGGMVVNAASEPDALVVNGMSNYSRAAEFSNSALVVTVRPDDFTESGPLAGVAFQRQWEQRAYQAGGGNWRAPAQPLLEFLQGKDGNLRSSCQPAVVHADLTRCLPEFATAGLRKALPQFNRRMRGFVGPEATLIGVETRTSAPVRILRDKAGESLSHSGLYPAGEGAGYAGGIMSAAVDGLKTALNIMQQYQV